MDRLRKLANFINQISLVGAYIGSITCGLMVLLCSAEIFSRTFLNVSIVISVELLPWFLVGMVFLGIPWTLSVDGHVQITIITNNLSQKAQKLFKISTCIVAIISCTLFSIWAWEGLRENYVSGTVGFTFPLWWAWVPMFIGSVQLILQLLVSLLNTILSLKPINQPVDRNQ